MLEKGDYIRPLEKRINSRVLIKTKNFLKDLLHKFRRIHPEELKG
jgi:hypothetical protein